MSGGLAAGASRGRVWLAYGLMAAVTVVLFLVIRSFGEGLTAPAVSAVSAADAVRAGVADAHADDLLRVLVALIAVIGVSRVLGAAFRHFHQPPVIGEVLAGIVLGPSLLGSLAPALSVHIFPPAVIPMLGILSQVGVLLFMFLIGLELDTNVLREQMHATVAISHASIVVPFLMGSGLALWLYPLLSSSDVSFTAFTLFMGISMSVTAFPVLARILSDRRLQRTRMGMLALTCAAIDDVTAWCLLALVVGVIHARVTGAGMTAVLTILYVSFMFAVVRPLMGRFIARYEGQTVPGQPLMATVCLVLLLSSLATEFIGIHSFFGAFLVGAVIPHDSTVARIIHGRLHDFVVVMLLPAFFAFVGLRMQINLIAGSQWLICGAIILTACAGKFGGSAVAARLTGMTWRDAACLGILMNTRGLMQLIVLNIGLDLKVISPTLFAMLVIMALVTTFMTTPVLDALTLGRWEEQPAENDTGLQHVR